MLKTTPPSYDTCLDALHDKLRKQSGNLAASETGFWLAEARTKAGLTDDQSLHLALLDHELLEPRLESCEKRL